ncbi:MAG: hypothetical protein AAF224_11630 [Pseudomonadota bacterium]
MKLLGMRFCRVAGGGGAEGLADLFRKLGVPERSMTPPPPDPSPADLSGDEAAATAQDAFMGAVFPVENNGENSWIEIWPAGENMPEMVMLQLIVDDADAFADHARQNGLDPKGPDLAHGEKIYYLAGPGGLPISFQSRTDGA